MSNRAARRRQQKEARKAERRAAVAAAGVPFHFKQWGEWLEFKRVGRGAAGRLLDGKEHNGFPVPLSVASLDPAQLAQAGAGGLR